MQGAAWGRFPEAVGLGGGVRLSMTGGVEKAKTADERAAMLDQKGSRTRRPRTAGAP